MGAISDRPGLEALVARSRLIGADPSLVLHGGGNTSSKLEEPDHHGVRRRVLRIKGSGRDLATARAEDFPGLWLDELLALRAREAMSDEEMGDYLARCLVEPSSPRPSIETLLHAFLPATHVDHVHADAICALANAPDPEAAVAEALGPEVAVVPYRRPGFALAQAVAVRAGSRAAVLVHHGLVTWGETDEEVDALTLEFVERARAFLGPVPETSEGTAAGGEDEAFLARLRGRLSRTRRQILVLDGGGRPAADRSDVGELAEMRSTPDHMLRIGSASCVLGRGEDPDAAVGAFEERYRAYHARHADGATPVLDPAPRIVLAPGLGVLAAAPRLAEARARLEIAAHTHASLIATLERFGAASRLSEREVFEFEHWPLELAKLAGAPAPAELSGHVVIVTGAGSGIGRAIAHELGHRGAELVLADRDGDGLAATAEALADPVCEVGDLRDPAVVDALVARAVRSLGGVDAVVFNAGTAATGGLATLEASAWRESIEVNLTAHFLLTRRVWPVLEAQGLGGSLVYVASKNAFAPGAGFGAYSVAKAGLVQLARIAALEGGSVGIRANAVNPDAVFEGSRLWSDEVRRERAAAHGVAPEELEAFYASRSLLGRPVAAADVAEAVAFLVSERSRATTGCVLPVDGGVPAAFPR